MEPAAFIVTLFEEPTSFQGLSDRLTATQDDFLPEWTAFVVNNVITWALSSYDTSTLTPTQLFRVSSLIQAVWPLDPVHNATRHNPHMTRKKVLDTYLDGDLDTVATIRRRLLSAAGPYSLSNPAADLPPPPLSRVASTPSAPHAPAAPVPPPADAHPGGLTTDSTAAAAPLHGHFRGPSSSTSSATTVRNISQYYTPARQFGGHPLQSLSRARAEFDRICDAFEVPASLRAVCLPFALKHSDLNLPALVSDARGRPEAHLWDLISRRVNTPARALRVREMWQKTTLAAEPTLPGDTPVARFERMLSSLALLQTQLPHSYQSPTMLYDKLLDATRSEWFAHSILAHPADSSHALISHIQLLLTAGPPPPPRPMPLASPLLSSAPPSPATPAYLADGAPVDAPRPGHAFLVNVEEDPTDNAQCWYVFKRFRANATTPCKTERTPFRRPPPSSDNPCHNCGAPDHFARTCPSPRRPPTPAAPSRAHLASPIIMSDQLSALTPPPQLPLPPAPVIHDKPAPAINYDDAYFILALLIPPVHSITEPDIATAIADIGTPGDIVGHSWLHQHPQLLTCPVRPATTTYALGHDVPASIGRVSMRLLTRAADGTALHLDLPNVHILRHDSVPLLVGLHSHKRLRLVVDAATDTIYAGPSRTPIR